MKSDVFNIERFWKYLKTDLSMAIQNYGISLLIICGFGLAAYIVAYAFCAVIPGVTWEGFGLPARITFFIISLVCLGLTMATKMYGGLTEKRAGTSFLMLPASRLEKFISMILVCVVIVPAVFVIVTFVIDFLLCTIDGQCGDTLMYTANNWIAQFSNLQTVLDEIPFEMNISTSVWTMVDDVMTIPLVFLLGALLFKKSKAAKTIGCIMIIAIVISLVSIPVATNFFEELDFMDFASFEDFKDAYPLLGSIIKHPTLYETLGDQILNIGLMVAIWFRLKTLKH